MRDKGDRGTAKNVRMTHDPPKTDLSDIDPVLPSYRRQSTSSKMTSGVRPVQLNVSCTSVELSSWLRRGDV